MPARLLLAATQTHKELELEVVDTWQADAMRDTRILSGGESFLVSLALALSDLVSHKTGIDRRSLTIPLILRRCILLWTR